MNDLESVYRQGTSQKQRQKKGAGKYSEAVSGAVNTERSMLQRAVTLANQNEATRSNHGPVKVIMKDGKYL